MESTGKKIKLASQSLFHSDQHVLEWIEPIQHALHATNTQTSEFGFWIKYSVCLSYSIGYTLGSLQSIALPDFWHHKKPRGWPKIHCENRLLQSARAVSSTIWTWRTGDYSNGNQKKERLLRTNSKTKNSKFRHMMVGRSVSHLYDCLLSSIEAETYLATSSCGKKTWHVILNAGDKRHCFPYPTSSTYTRVTSAPSKSFCMMLNSAWSLKDWKADFCQTAWALGVEPIPKSIFIEFFFYEKEMNFWWFA